MITFTVFLLMCPGWMIEGLINYENYFIFGLEFNDWNCYGTSNAQMHVSLEAGLVVEVGHRIVNEGLLLSFDGLPFLQYENNCDI